MDEDPALVVGRWVHAHEEDDAEHRVFRRAGSPMPPSRGRTEFEIGPDLSASRIGPGADDRMTFGPEIRVVFGKYRGPAGASGEIRVTAVKGDRLWIARE